MQDKTTYQSIAVAMCLFMIAALLWGAMGRTDGMLIFTLDDPYIHLSVAETILAGGYGVNVDEYASPSSSIIYPFLLAGALAIGLGDYGALVLNVIGAVGCAWIIAGVFWSSTVHPKSRPQVLFALLSLPFLLLSLNLISLPLTGMEHTLHVMTSMIVILGMYNLDQGKSPSLWVLAAIILVPLLRFEGIALAGAAIIALVLTRRFGAATLVSAVLVAVFASYFAYMSRLGLPMLPSSVLVKSSIGAAVIDQNFVNTLGSVIVDVLFAMKETAGVLLVVGAAFILMGVTAFERGRRIPWCLIGVSLAAISAHLVAGKYGWFGRYEIYILGIMFVAVLLVWAPTLLRQTRNVGFRSIGIMALLAGVSGPYVFIFLQTPGASENIYAQQYQMHRFSVDYFPQPVAINDLGWVSYRNNTHVLDLWGLGSEDARGMNASQGRTEQSVAALTTQAGSVYAMIYEDWFYGAIPTEWCHVATLTTPSVTSASPNVEFYLIDLDYMGEFERALEVFSQTIPAVSSFRFHGCAR